MTYFRVTFMHDNVIWSEVHSVDNIVLFSQLDACKAIRFDLFTGFRDIYAGDIVEVHGDGLHLVVFIDGCFCAGETPLIKVIESTTVKGNMYDNPELLQ